MTKPYPAPFRSHHGSTPNNAPIFQLSVVYIYTSHHILVVIYVIYLLRNEWLCINDRKYNFFLNHGTSVGKFEFNIQRGSTASSLFVVCLGKLRELNTRLQSC
jgi:hypothetical protein